MSTLLLFWTIFKASLLSTGGMGNAPIIHHDLVTTGLATERQFTSALAIGQLSPGPTGLWIVALGYMLGGSIGALTASVAVFLPPLLVLAVAALYRRANEHPGVEGFVWGLGVTVSGVSAAVLLGILGDEGLFFAPLAIAVIALLLGLHGRLPVFLIIVAGAVAGLLLR